MLLDMAQYLAILGPDNRFFWLRSWEPNDEADDCQCNGFQKMKLFKIVTMEAKGRVSTDENQSSLRPGGTGYQSATTWKRTTELPSMSANSTHAPASSSASTLTIAALYPSVGMIVLINGSFGIGKSTVARLLRRRVPRSLVYNPEWAG